jgi:putative oxidoreductase
MRFHNLWLCLERVLAVFLILLLARSALSHISNPYYFLSSVHAYQLLNKTLGEWFAMTLPFLQLVLSLALAIRWAPLASWLVCSLLFLLFLFAQYSVIWRGMEISCGCFGVADGVHVGWGTLSIAGSGLVVSFAGVLINLRLMLAQKKLLLNQR